MSNEKNLRELVLFLGAGASSWAGYKTFLNFPAMFWPSGNEPGELQITDKERTLLNEIKAHLEKRHLPSTLDSYLRAIDEFQTFTSSSVSHTILRDRVLASSVQWANVQELRRLLMTIRNRICLLTAEHYSKPPKVTSELIQEVQGFYSSLLSLPKCHLTVFTTNYDILPEHLFSNDSYFKEIRKNKSPIELNNGFTELCGNMSEFHRECVYNRCKHSRNCKCMLKALKRKNMPSISWHRLHGCVSWIRSAAENQNINFQIGNFSDIENFSDRLCVSYPGHEQAYGEMPHAKSFIELARLTSASSLIVFVGFAFRDPDVMSVIGRSLIDNQYAKNNKMRFLVFDPYLSKDEILERLRLSLRTTSQPTIEWNSDSFTIIPTRFPDPIVLNSIKQYWKVQ